MAGMRPAGAASLGFMLIWLTLMVRVLVPPGLMITAPDHAGSVAIVICTAEGSKIVSPVEAPAEPHVGEHVCALSALSAGFTPPIVAQVATVAWRAIQAPLTLLSYVRPGLGLAAPPPPATGPPALI